MNWSGKKAFAAAPMVKFVVDGAEAGTGIRHGSLSFLKVRLHCSGFSYSTFFLFS